MAVSISAHVPCAQEPAAAERAPIPSALRQLILDAALVDPNTGETDHGRLGALRAQQHRILAQLRQPGRREINQNDLETHTRDETDAAHEILANYRILGLSNAARKRWVKTWTDYADQLTDDFQETLAKLAPGHENASLRARIRSRWNSPVHIEMLYLTHSSRRRPTAYYVPLIHTFFLDLNASINRGGLLADSFEHELWHHLLPTVTPYTMADNPWAEGFNEALAEWWDHLRLPARPTAERGPVIYPVTTAYASLFYACDIGLTMRWLDGELNIDHYARALTDARFDPLPSLPALLAQSIATAWQVSDRHRVAANAMLANWGWKSATGDPLQLNHLIKDGRLDRHDFNRAFAGERRFTMAVVDALTVCILQDLMDAVPRRKLLRATRKRIPPQLQSNLRRALNHATRPDHPIY